MKCTILHEGKGRMRVHVEKVRMTLHRADVLEAYLNHHDAIVHAAVYERTGDVVITYTGRRSAAIAVLAGYKFDVAEYDALVTSADSRRLNREYQDKMFDLVAGRCLRKLFLPAPLDAAYTAFRSIRFLWKGVRCVLSRRLEVEVLDALSIGVSLLRGDFGTAGSVMFLLNLGSLLEEWTRKKSLDGKLYAIGVPAILNLALPSLLVTFLNGLLAGFSQSYVVVLGIYYKLQTFLYLPANGIVQGMRPLIGYNYGAKQHARVKKLYELTLIMSAAIMAAGTVICLFASRPLMQLFTSNPETVAIGQTALRIICLGFVVSAVSTTSSGALEGLGKGAESLVISLCRYIVFIMPLAAVLCHFLGANGVWHAFWITEVLSAIGVPQGSWKVLSLLESAGR